MLLSPADEAKVRKMSLQFQSLLAALENVRRVFHEAEKAVNNNKSLWSTVNGRSVREQLEKLVEKFRPKDRCDRA